MGTLIFSKRYSFLDEGEDVGGMLGAIYTYMENAAPLTQIPWADKLLFKNWLAPQQDACLPSQSSIL
ncbi:hypothetical protein LTR17_024802 [Elasticomyces elasticus]|nr:hypothetical protein LTR17_024802 [Elasticomyces elasticus]